MTVSRISALTAIAVTGVLALAACGSDAKTTTPDSSATAAGSSTGTGSAPGGTSVTDCFSGDLNAEGSSAQKNAIEVAIAEYGKQCTNANISYNATGSGAGVKQFIARQVDFGGSDSVMKDEEKASAKAACGSDAWDIPMVVGPIAVAYNLSGVDKLVLDAATTAKIFKGDVTTWNDPAIAALNSGVTLPSKPIKVFFRSDDSGTTDNIQKYLEAASEGGWTKTGKKWGGTVGEGKPQNAGVAQAIKGQDGSIGYLEWSYVTQNKLQMARINTGAAEPVELTAESVGKAVNAAKQAGEGNDLALKLDYATKEDGAYPIILVTYELVCSKYPEAETAKKVKSFLKLMASPDVQAKMQDKGYSPLPQEMYQKVSTAIDAIQ